MLIKPNRIEANFSSGAIKLNRAKSAIKRKIIKGFDSVRKKAVTVSCEYELMFSLDLCSFLKGLVLNI
jgi:hypothetical protein